MISIDLGQIILLLFIVPVAVIGIFFLWGLCYALFKEMHNVFQGKENFCFIREQESCPENQNKKTCLKYGFTGKRTYENNPACDEKRLKRSHPEVWQKIKDTEDKS